MSWTILLTTPQSEFRVRDELIERGASAVVPVEFRWSRGETKRPMRRPVIPGYVFAVIDNWATVFTRPLSGLSSRPVLLIEGRPALLSQDAADALLALSRPIQELRQSVRIGDRLRVKLGHLTDLQADVARITAKGQPVAVVQLFGKAHEVTLTDGQWEAA